MASHDITVRQGETFSKTLTLTDDSDVAINITNDTFAGQVRKYHASTGIEATFTFTITDGPNGVVVWSLTDTQTSAMSSGPLVYDVEHTKQDGTVTRILEGIANTTPEVTRP